MLNFRQLDGWLAGYPHFLTCSHIEHKGIVYAACITTGSQADPLRAWSNPEQAKLPMHTSNYIHRCLMKFFFSYRLYCYIDALVCQLCLSMHMQTCRPVLGSWLQNKAFEQPKMVLHLHGWNKHWQFKPVPFLAWPKMVHSFLLKVARGAIFCPLHFWQDSSTTLQTMPPVNSILFTVVLVLSQHAIPSMISSLLLA